MYFRQLDEGLGRLKEFARQNKELGEIRLIKIPALNIEAFWLHYEGKTADIICPVRRFENDTTIDWDKAYSAAEYLIQIAQKGGIERCFDTAEGMALATNQRELWENERGMALDTDTVRDIADYTRENWEMSL